MPAGERLMRLAAKLHARAQPPLPAGLVPFVIAGRRVGMANTAVAQFLARTGDFDLQERALQAGQRVDDRLVKVPEPRAHPRNDGDEDYENDHLYESDDTKCNI